MIFVTVGTQLAFDRLIVAIDQWAENNGHAEIYAQIGPTNYSPKNFPNSRFLSPQEFNDKVKESRLIISHAGMGTIITALQYRKRLLVFPRIAEKGEHRNNHQISTAKKLIERKLVDVAMNEEELNVYLNSGGFITGGQISPFATPELISAIKNFLDESL